MKINDLRNILFLLKSDSKVDKTSRIYRGYITLFKDKATPFENLTSLKNTEARNQEESEKVKAFKTVLEPILEKITYWEKNKPNDELPTAMEQNVNELLTKIQNVYLDLFVKQGNGINHELIKANITEINKLLEPLPSVSISNTSTDTANATAATNTQTTKSSSNTKPATGISAKQLREKLDLNTDGRRNNAFKYARFFDTGSNALKDHQSLLNSKMNTEDAYFRVKGMGENENERQIEAFRHLKEILALTLQLLDKYKNSDGPIPNLTEDNALKLKELVKNSHRNLMFYDPKDPVYNAEQAKKETVQLIQSLVPEDVKKQGMTLSQFRAEVDLAITGTLSTENLKYMTLFKERNVLDSADTLSKATINEVHDKAKALKFKSLLEPVMEAISAYNTSTDENVVYPVFADDMTTRIRMILRGAYKTLITNQLDVEEKQLNEWRADLRSLLPPLPENANNQKNTAPTIASSEPPEKTGIAVQKSPTPEVEVKPQQGMSATEFRAKVGLKNDPPFSPTNIMINNLFDGLGKLQTSETLENATPYSGTNPEKIKVFKTLLKPIMDMITLYEKDNPDTVRPELTTENAKELSEIISKNYEEVFSSGGIEYVDISKFDIDGVTTKIKALLPISKEKTNSVDTDTSSLSTRKIEEHKPVDSSITKTSADSTAVKVQEDLSTLEPIQASSTVTEQSSADKKEKNILNDAPPAQLPIESEQGTETAKLTEKTKDALLEISPLIPKIEQMTNSTDTNILTRNQNVTSDNTITNTKTGINAEILRKRLNLLYISNSVPGTNTDYLKYQRVFNGGGTLFDSPETLKNITINSKNIELSLGDQNISKKEDLDKENFRRKIAAKDFKNVLLSTLEFIDHYKNSDDPIPNLTEAHVKEINSHIEKSFESIYNAKIILNTLENVNKLFESIKNPKVAITKKTSTNLRAKKLDETTQPTATVKDKESNVSLQPIQASSNVTEQESADKIEKNVVNDALPAQQQPMESQKISGTTKLTETTKDAMLKTQPEVKKQQGTETAKLTETTKDAMPETQKEVKKQQGTENVLQAGTPQSKNANSSNTNSLNPISSYSERGKRFIKNLYQSNPQTQAQTTVKTEVKVTDEQKNIVQTIPSTKTAEVEPQKTATVEAVTSNTSSSSVVTSPESQASTNTSTTKPSNTNLKMVFAKEIQFLESLQSKQKASDSQMTNSNDGITVNRNQSRLDNVKSAFSSLTQRLSQQRTSAKEQSVPSNDVIGKRIAALRAGVLSESPSELIPYDKDMDALETLYNKHLNSANSDPNEDAVLTDRVEQIIMDDFNQSLKSNAKTQTNDSDDEESLSKQTLPKGKAPIKTMPQQTGGSSYSSSSSSSSTNNVQKVDYAEKLQNAAAAAKSAFKSIYNKPVINTVTQEDIAETPVVIDGKVIALKKLAKTLISKITTSEKLPKSADIDKASSLEDIKDLLIAIRNKISDVNSDEFKRSSYALAIIKLDKNISIKVKKFLETKDDIQPDYNATMDKPVSKELNVIKDHLKINIGNIDKIIRESDLGVETFENIITITLSEIDSTMPSLNKIPDNLSEEYIKYYLATRYYIKSLDGTPGDTEANAVHVNVPDFTKIFHNGVSSDELLETLAFFISDHSNISKAFKKETHLYTKLAEQMEIIINEFQKIISDESYFEQHSKDIQSTLSAASTTYKENYNKLPFAVAMRRKAEGTVVVKTRTPAGYKALEIDALRYFVHAQELAIERMQKKYDDSPVKTKPVEELVNAINKSKELIVNANDRIAALEKDIINNKTSAKPLPVKFFSYFKNDDKKDDDKKDYVSDITNRTWLSKYYYQLEIAQLINEDGYLYGDIKNIPIDNNENHYNFVDFNKLKNYVKVLGLQLNQTVILPTYSNVQLTDQEIDIFESEAKNLFQVAKKEKELNQAMSSGLITEKPDTGAKLKALVSKRKEFKNNIAALKNSAETTRIGHIKSNSTLSSNYATSDIIIKILKEFSPPQFTVPGMDVTKENDISFIMRTTAMAYYLHAHLKMHQPTNKDVNALEKALAKMAESFREEQIPDSVKTKEALDYLNQDIMPIFENHAAFFGLDNQPNIDASKPNLPLYEAPEEPPLYSNNAVKPLKPPKVKALSKADFYSKMRAFLALKLVQEKKGSGHDINNDIDYILNHENISDIMNTYNKLMISDIDVHLKIMAYHLLDVIPLEKSLEHLEYAKNEFVIKPPHTDLNKAITTIKQLMLHVQRDADPDLSWKQLFDLRDSISRFMGAYSLLESSLDTYEKAPSSNKAEAYAQYNETEIRFNQETHLLINFALSLDIKSPLMAIPVINREQAEEQLQDLYQNIRKVEYARAGRKIMIADDPDLEEDPVIILLDSLVVRARDLYQKQIDLTLDSSLEKFQNLEQQIEALKPPTESYSDHVMIAFMRGCERLTALTEMQGPPAPIDRNIEDLITELKKMQEHFKNYQLYMSQNDNTHAEKEIKDAFNYISIIRQLSSEEHLQSLSVVQNIVSPVSSRSTPQTNTGTASWFRNINRLREWLGQLFKTKPSPVPDDAIAVTEETKEDPNYDKLSGTSSEPESDMDSDHNFDEDEVIESPRAPSDFRTIVIPPESFDEPHRGFQPIIHRDDIIAEVNIPEKSIGKIMTYYRPKEDEFIDETRAMVSAAINHGKKEPLFITGPNKKLCDTIMKVCIASNISFSTDLKNGDLNLDGFTATGTQDQDGTWDYKPAAILPTSANVSLVIGTSFTDSRGGEYKVDTKIEEAVVNQNIEKAVKLAQDAQKNVVVKRHSNRMQ